jgi:hypothetical protein
MLVGRTRSTSGSTSRSLCCGSPKTAQEVLKAGIGAQGFENGLHIYVMEIRGTLVIGFLQPFERLIFAPKPSVDSCHIVRGDIPTRRYLGLLAKDLVGLASTSRHGMAISEPSEIKRMIPGKCGCALKLLNRLRKHSLLHVNPAEV